MRIVENRTMSASRSWLNYFERKMAIKLCTFTARTTEAIKISLSTIYDTCNYISMP